MSLYHAGGAQFSKFAAPTQVARLGSGRGRGCEKNREWTRIKTRCDSNHGSGTPTLIIAMNSVDLRSFAVCSLKCFPEPGRKRLALAIVEVFRYLEALREAMQLSH